MKEKVRRIKNEDGSDTYESMDGKQYKTRSGAWKRNQRLTKEEPPTAAPTEPTTETDPLPHDTADNWEPLSEKPPTATEEDPDFTGPEWAQFDYGDIPEGAQVIPEPLKKIQRMGGKGKATKADLKAEEETNKAILKMGYRTGDLMMTRYSRAVTVDPEAPAITHSEDDYDWISGITYSWMESQGISVAHIMGPGVLALGANAYWFGTPLYHIQKKAKKSIIRGAGRKIGGLKKFFRLPRFLRRKSQEPVINTDEWPEGDSAEGFEP